MNISLVFEKSNTAAPLPFGFNFVKKSAAYTWTFTVLLARL